MRTGVYYQDPHFFITPLSGLGEVAHGHALGDAYLLGLPPTVDASAVARIRDTVGYLSC